MKKILIVLYLGLAIGAIGLVPVGLAHAQEAADVTVNIDKGPNDEAVQGEDGFSVSFSIGEDSDSAEQKLNKLADKLSVVLGDDAAEKLRLELDGMDQAKKKEIVSKMSDGFFIDPDDMDGLDGMEMVVALTAIVLTLGMPVIILLLVLFFASRKRRQKMELVRTYLDAGKDVPDQVLAEFSGGANSLRAGVTPIAVGAGLIGASLIIEDATPLAAFGLIPLFIGIARLIYWKYEDTSENKPGS